MSNPDQGTRRLGRRMRFLLDTGATHTSAPAHLNPRMRNDEVLLGMSVLKHLEFTQRGDVLVLRKPAG